MLDLSEKESSPFQRSSFLYKAEEILAREVPVVPLFYKPDQALIRKDFQINNQPGLSGCFNQARTIFKRR